MALLQALNTMSDGELRIEALPPDFPSGLLAGGARVIGSYASAQRNVAVISMPMNAYAALDTLEARVRTNGWTEAPRGPEPGGFRPPGYERTRPTLYCRGGRITYFETGVAEADRSIMLVHNGPLPCPDLPPQVLNRWTAPLPLLYPPRGAAVRNGAGGSPQPEGGAGTTEYDYFNARSAIHTSLGIAEVQLHYERLLRRAGWTAIDSTRQENIWVTTYRLQDSERADWLANFVLWTPPGLGVVDLGITMRKVK